MGKGISSGLMEVDMWGIGERGNKLVRGSLSINLGNNLWERRQKVMNDDLLEL